MWLFTTRGFYSVTSANFNHPAYKDREKPADYQIESYLVVRARVGWDLKRLKELYEDEVGGTFPEVDRTVGRDYPYRVLMRKSEWKQLVERLVEEADYYNFKDAVEAAYDHQRAGQARHDLYMKVWSVMYRAEDWLKQKVREKRTQTYLDYYKDVFDFRKDPFDTK